MLATRRLILQKARRHPRPPPSGNGQTRLRRLVGARFQVLFHSPPGVLFTIPSRYYPLSVTRKYLGLPGGPGRFTADYRSPPLLGNMRQTDHRVITYRTITVYGNAFQRLRLTICFITVRPCVSRISTVPQPRTRNPCQVSHVHGLASSAFARHYSRNHCCFLFLPVLRCFTSRRSLHTPYVFRCG